MAKTLVYLDASFLVAFFTSDAFTARATTMIQADAQDLIVSDFAAAEFASVMARLARMGELRPNEARTALSSFDVWAAASTDRAETDAADIRVAEAFLRRLDLPLRTADALNIAIAQRVEATLLTFDRKMTDSAQRLGLPVAGL
jgi:predicted nucleic acid-binding protein